MTGYREFTATDNDDGKRLDRVVRRLCHAAPLGSVFRAIRRGDVRVNGVRVPGEHRVMTGDHIQLRDGTILADRADPDGPSGIRHGQDGDAGEYPGKTSGGDAVKHPESANDLPEILFENDNVLFLNKPAGVTVHGPDSLEHTVRRYLAGRIEPSLSFRPGPLHRLDHNTTGVLGYARSLAGARVFAEALRAGRVHKLYLGILQNGPERDETWNTTLSRDSHTGRSFEDPDGVPAVTTARPLARSHRNGPPLVLACLETRTGRPHQIRVQASGAGYPLLGDLKYKGNGARGGFYLHAWCISITDPDRVLGFDRLCARPPDRFLAMIEKTFPGILPEILGCHSRLAPIE